MAFFGSWMVVSIVIGWLLPVPKKQLLVKCRLNFEPKNMLNIFFYWITAHHFCRRNVNCIAFFFLSLCRRSIETKFPDDVSSHGWRDIKHIDIRIIAHSQTLSHTHTGHRTFVKRRENISDSEPVRLRFAFLSSLEHEHSTPHHSSPMCTYTKSFSFTIS